MNAHDFSGLPDALPAIAELMARPQWVAWKYDYRNGPDKKPTKPPVSPKSGFGASHSDPKTWGTYQEATQLAVRRGLPGVGYVISPDDEYTGIDLDSCIGPDGDLEPWAAEIVALGETYCEVSPSGFGLRLIARGKIDKTVKCDPAHVEIYRDSRYLTITGSHYGGTPNEIRPAPKTIEALLARIAATREEAKRGGAQTEGNHPGNPASAPVLGGAQSQIGWNGNHPSGSDFFSNVNTRALECLSLWVPAIFGASARFQPGTGSYRVSSKALGRNLQEDLSIAPTGIVDFGTHDMGDARDGKRTAIDICLEYGNQPDARAAAFWLCGKFGVQPETMGWSSAPDPIEAAAAAEILRVAAEARQAETASATNAPQPRGRLTNLGADIAFEPPEEVVRDTIPARGVGFLGGQSGAFKSFTAVELAFAIGTGQPFAGRKVERPGGVLYCAFEGAGTIVGRVKARRSRLSNPDDEVPFLMLDAFGPVASDADFTALAAEIGRAAATMEAQWGAPLRAVIIDTVAAAGMIAEDKENDPAAWQRVFDRLNAISAAIDAPIILVHHYGKDASAGLRGSSNARAGADFVLAMTCQRDELTGDTSNHFLALTKSRTAPEGGIASVRSVEVEIGQRSDGSPITSLVLEFDAGTKLRTVGKPSKAVAAFLAAFDEALHNEGETVHVHGDRKAPQVRAVRLADVRDEFDKRYVTASTDGNKRTDNLRKQFKNAVDHLPSRIVVGAWDNTEWAWHLSAGGRGPSNAE